MCSGAGSCAPCARAAGRRIIGDSAYRSIFSIVEHRGCNLKTSANRRRPIALHDDPLWGDDRLVKFLRIQNLFADSAWLAGVSQPTA